MNRFVERSATLKKKQFSQTKWQRLHGFLGCLCAGAHREPRNLCSQSRQSQVYCQVFVFNISECCVFTKNVIFKKRRAWTLSVQHEYNTFLSRSFASYKWYKIVSNLSEFYEDCMILAVYLHCHKTTILLYACLIQNNGRIYRKLHRFGVEPFFKSSEITSFLSSNWQASLILAFLQGSSQGFPLSVVPVAEEFTPIICGVADKEPFVWSSCFIPWWTKYKQRDVKLA